MPFIVFLGCDGSGKSTVISQLSDRLQTRGIEVWNGHWCPVAGGGDKTTAPDPHGQIPRGFFASIAKLVVLCIRWWRAWIFGGWGHISRSGVVLFDRYYGDLCVDPIRYRYGAAMWLAEFWTGLLPQPDFLFFLDADPEVLLSRKQEVGRDALERSRYGYKMLVERAGGRVIDVARPVEAVVDEIYQLIARDCKAVSTPHP
jgi:thymidylate kinase